jgi:trimethylamine:corrinoid methyltransferase-like protein
VDMLTGVGMVSGGRVFSYPEMVLAAETMAAAREIAGGVQLAATPPLNTLGRDLSYEEWLASGRETAVERATARVRDIVATHQPPALAASVDVELRRLIGG